MARVRARTCAIVQAWDRTCESACPRAPMRVRACVRKACVPCFAKNIMGASDTSLLNSTKQSKIRGPGYRCKIAARVGPAVRGEGTVG
jgi:hypothetical protein